MFKEGIVKVLLATLLTASGLQLNAQIQDSEPCGYASLEGGTTGGAGGPVVVPTSFAELQQYASGTDPVIILIDREFKGPNVLKLGSNKTLFGVGTKGFINQIGVSIQSQHNIIIRNLKFTMTGVPITNDGENKIAGFNFDPDCIAIQADDETLPEAQRKSSHIWIDHCEFYNEDPTVMTDYDRYDGLLDAKNNCQYITISWNYFHDHHKACLFGKGNSDDFDRKITMHHNKFENIGSRMPLMRFGKLHMFNNYTTRCLEGNGLNVRINSNAYVEKNYYEDVKKPIFGKISEGGKAVLKDNIFKNCDRMPSITLPNALSPKASSLSSSEEFETSSYIPPYQCASITFPVVDVPAKVNQYVGVGKLQAPAVVTGITGIEDDLNNSVYPNPTQGLINLNGKCIWTLINHQGQVLQDGHSEFIDLSGYTSGMYFLKLDSKVVKIQKQ
ncbi:MAG: T9SS type A sorting domain-containing protein [Sporocytophaga sp.]|nr:T9SS type A sorting domain-containing protein [Sporocytophaga sp.]